MSGVVGGDDAQRGWVTPFGVRGRAPGPLELGAFPACGFRLLLRPRRPLSDVELLDALALAPHHPLDPAAAVDRFVVSVTPFGPWTHAADDHGLWNDRDRRKAALRAAPRLGDLFTFQPPIRT